MDKSHKNNIERKKLDTKITYYFFIYINFIRQKESMALEIKKRDVFGKKRRDSDKAYRGISGEPIMFSRELNAGYTGM